MAGTLDAIERNGRMRVGFAALPGQDREIAGRFVARLEAATGAQAQISSGPAERLLGELEDGDLDLVIGEFRRGSPWVAAVTIVEPLRRRAAGSHVLGLSPVAANGENRWVALLEREVRNSAGQSSE